MAVQKPISERFDRLRPCIQLHEEIRLSKKQTTGESTGNFPKTQVDMEVSQEPGQFPLDSPVVHFCEIVFRPAGFDSPEGCQHRHRPAALATRRAGGIRYLQATGCHMGCHRGLNN